METVKENIAPLIAGDTLTWEEFEERWNAAPEIKFAELIGGRVYMPPPVSSSHSYSDLNIHTLLGVYSIQTPGCIAGTNATCLMLGDAPQPDALLRIRDDFGGQSRDYNNHIHGAPELIIEICLSSTAYDLHDKKELYRKAGVQEYIALLENDQKLLWHRLAGDKYEFIRSSEDGISRSHVFPGFWLCEEALLKRDLLRCYAILNAGLASSEHATFAAELAGRQK